MKTLAAQSCLTICNPMDCSSLPGSMSMDFSRQEYWSGFPFPSPGYLPDPGIKPRSPALQANSLLSEAPGKPQVAMSKASKLINSRGRIHFQQI